MVKLSGMAKKLMLITACFTAVCGVVMAFLIEGRLALILGLALGLCVSVARIYLLEQAINKTLDAEEKRQGQLSMQLAFMSRTALAIAALVVGAVWEPVEFFGVVAGIVAMPTSAYIARFVFKNEFKDGEMKAVPEEDDSEDDDSEGGLNISERK